jgi:hypothetical protein
MAQRLSLPSAALCLAVVAVALALAVLHSADSSARTPSSPLYALLSLGVKLVLTSILVLLAQLALAWWIERPTLSRDRGADRARAATCGGPMSSLRPRRVAVRPLYFTSPAAWSVTQTRARWEAAAAATAKKEEPSSSSSSASASDAALDSVLQLVEMVLSPVRLARLPERRRTPHPRRPRRSFGPRRPRRLVRDPRRTDLAPPDSAPRKMSRR